MLRRWQAFIHGRNKQKGEGSMFPLAGQDAAGVVG